MNGRRAGLALVFFGLGAAQGCGFFDSAYVPGVDHPIEEDGVGGDDGAGGEADTIGFARPDSDTREIQKLPFEEGAAVCGDGIVSASEPCDDGAKDGGDGCSAGCHVESGFVCVIDASGLSSCHDIDECEDGSAACAENAACVNQVGSYGCTCALGFQVTGSVGGLACVDSDECASGLHNCDPRATCSNTFGSFECACVAGFVGDGTLCVDADECALGIDECDEHATCVNGEGGYSCDCLDGWQLAGGSCHDIDECASGDAGCSENAACFNDHGSFQCFCHEGFVGDGFDCEESTG